MTVSDELKGDAWVPESDLPLALLTIEHPDISPAVHVVNALDDITSVGQEFTAYPFDLELPSSPEQGPPRARIRIDNISGEIVEALRAVASPPTVTLQLILQASPDTVESEHRDFRLTGVSWDAMSVEGDLTREDLMREPFPFLTFSPAEFKGLVP